MKFIKLIILIFPFIIMNAQTTTLRILGQSNYIENAETNVAIIAFNKEEIETKKTALILKIDSIGISSSLHKIIESYNNNNFQERFEVEEQDPELFENFLAICYKLQVRIEKVYFRMPIHKTDHEDKYAIRALRNANSQAEIILNNLDYKIVKILNIDDETTFSDPIFDFIDKDSERGKMVINIIQLLSSTDPNETQSNSPERYGGYNLWVTYEIEHK